MKSISLDHERLFEPFVDEIDGVACVSAQSTASDLAALAGPLNLRFPLWLDPSQPLRANLAAGDYAPASSRFGPFCDNITGMNWERPDGRIVRVGERVVKSVTGYDLLRFFLGAGGRFGKARDFVLRLRPLCDKEGVVFLAGQPRALEKAAGGMLHGHFLHWLDSVDWVVNPGQRPELRVGIHCPSPEWAAFEDYLAALAARHDLTLREARGREAMADGLPDLALKTTPDEVVPLCGELAAGDNVRCVGLCAAGAVHVYLPPTEKPAAEVAAIVARFAPRVVPAGGDWVSRHLERFLGCEEEGRWVQGLAESLGAKR